MNAYRFTPRGDAARLLLEARLRELKPNVEPTKRTRAQTSLLAREAQLFAGGCWSDCSDITRGQYPALQRPVMASQDLTRLARRMARGQYTPRYREQIDAYAAASRYARRADHYASIAAAECVAREHDYAAADDAAAQRAQAHRATYPRRISIGIMNAARPANNSAVFGRIQLLPERRANDTTLFDRTAAELESYADYLLSRYAGVPIHRTDVMDRKTRRITIAPDRVAFRGVARYVRPIAAVADSRGDTTDAASGVTQLGVRLRGARRVFIGYDARGNTVHTRTTDTTRRGWIGHAAYAIPRPVRARGAASTAARAAARPKRVDGSAARGRAVSAWSLSPRSMPRRWRDATDAQRDAAALIVTRLTAATDDAPIRVSDGTTITRRDGTTITRHTGASFGVIDYSRRAALALVTVA